MFRYLFFSKSELLCFLKLPLEFHHLKSKNKNTHCGYFCLWRASSTRVLSEHDAGQPRTSKKPRKGLFTGSGRGGRDFFFPENFRCLCTWKFSPPAGPLALWARGRSPGSQKYKAVYIVCDTLQIPTISRP